MLRALLPDVEWTVPLISGLEMTLNVKQHLSLLRKASRLKEVAIATQLATRVPAKGVLYDVGANIGLYSLVFAETRARHVHSFEPGVTALSFLRKNIARAKLRNVVIHPIALTDRSGTCRFVLDAMTTATSHVAGEWEAGVDVPCADLDTYVRDQKLPVPDLVKIDVEGHDMAVLRGMRRVLSDNRPMIWLEGGSRDEQGRSESIAYLNALGYTAWNLEQTREIQVDARDYAFLAIASARK